MDTFESVNIWGRADNWEIVIATNDAGLVVVEIGDGQGTWVTKNCKTLGEALRVAATEIGEG